MRADPSDAYAPGLVACALRKYEAAARPKHASVTNNQNQLRQEEVTKVRTK